MEQYNVKERRTGDERKQVGEVESGVQGEKQSWMSIQKEESSKIIFESSM